MYFYADELGGIGRHMAQLDAVYLGTYPADMYKAGYLPHVCLSLHNRL